MTTARENLLDACRNALGVSSPLRAVDFVVALDAYLEERVAPLLGAKMLAEPPPVPPVETGAPAVGAPAWPGERVTMYWYGPHWPKSFCPSSKQADGVKTFDYVLASVAEREAAELRAKLEAEQDEVLRLEVARRAEMLRRIEAMGIDSLAMSNLDPAARALLDEMAELREVNERLRACVRSREAGELAALAELDEVRAELDAALKRVAALEAALRDMTGSKCTRVFLSEHGHRFRCEREAGHSDDGAHRTWVGAERIQWWNGGHGDAGPIYAGDPAPPADVQAEAPKVEPKRWELCEHDNLRLRCLKCAMQALSEAFGHLAQYAIPPGRNSIAPKVEHTPECAARGYDTIAAGGGLIGAHMQNRPCDCDFFARVVGGAATPPKPDAVPDIPPPPPPIGYQDWGKDHNAIGGGRKAT
jgi:hypothetical protein